MRFSLCRAAQPPPAKSRLPDCEFDSVQAVPSFQAIVICAKTGDLEFFSRSTAGANLSDSVGIHLSRILAVPKSRPRSVVAKSIASPITPQANPLQGASNLLQDRSLVSPFIVVSPATLDPISADTILPTVPCSPGFRSGYGRRVE